jgi:hypothetical protein
MLSAIPPDTSAGSAHKGHEWLSQPTACSHKQIQPSHIFMLTGPHDRIRLAAAALFALALLATATATLAAPDPCLLLRSSCCSDTTPISLVLLLLLLLPPLAAAAAARFCAFSRAALKEAR